MPNLPSFLMGQQVKVSTIEGNKLIAEFMGGEPFNFINEFDEIVCGFEVYGSAYPLKSLEYHLSWDWLMPVVEKIESLLLSDIEIEGKACKCQPLNNVKILSVANSKIEAVWCVVVDFIKWNNEQKSNQE